MIRFTIGQFFMMLLVLISETYGFGATNVNVRVVSAKNGKPMKDAMVLVIIDADQGPDWQHRGTQFLYQKTKDNGVATFELGPALPTTIFVQDDSGLSAHCAGSKISLSKAMAEGAVVANRCGKLRGPMPLAKPGEIILFTRHLKWWQAGQT